MNIENIIKLARPEVLKIKSYSSARSQYKFSRKNIYIDANECPFEPYIGAENLSRYPEQQPSEVIKKLSQLYNISKNKLVVMRGADEGIDILLRVFCNPKRDNVIINVPTFPMYERSSIIHGLKVKKIPLTKSFELNINQLYRQANSNTKIIFICSPNNPTGNIFNKNTIIEICKSFTDKSIIVLDETYIEFANEKSFVSLLNKIPNLIILRTLSKGFAAAGVRCGVTIAHKKISELIVKILPPYPIPTPVIKEVLEILNEKNLSEIDKKRTEIIHLKNNVIEKLKKAKEIKKIYHSETNFIFMKVMNAENFCKKFSSKGIIIRNQSNQIGYNNHVRLTIGTEMEMNKFLSILFKDEDLNKKVARVSSFTRKTNETSISVKINLDEAFPVKVSTGIGFFDHMIEQIAKHAGISIELECNGDLNIDSHHTIEDCAISLGQALKKALSNKIGIERFGFILPMDDAIANVAIDLSGRFYLKFKGNFPSEKLGDMPTDMVEHFFYSLGENLQATIHISVEGENTHHMVEACFKGFGRAIKQAIKLDGSDILPSTKGII